MNKPKMLYLAHLGYNMWLEPRVDKNGVHGQRGWCDDVDARDCLRFDEDYWLELTDALRKVGCDAILLDLGEGLRYESHPELAVRGSWSKQKLSDELSRLRSLGFEVFPKLNFSAAHDYWLGEYARMLSTSIYYRVAGDLITEVSELFGRPALFHLGMDEETAENQRENNYLVIRQYEQWWYDFNILTKAVEAAGCRPWIWSDYGWKFEDRFFANMSKEVVQSNWYYGDFGDTASKAVQMYDKLSARGYDQIPTGSTWSLPDNLTRTVKYCGTHIAPEHILGYMQTPWYPTLRVRAEKHEQATADLKNAAALL